MLHQKEEANQKEDPRYRKHGVEPTGQVEGVPRASATHDSETPTPTWAGRWLQDVCIQEAGIIRMPLNIRDVCPGFWFRHVRSLEVTTPR